MTAAYDEITVARLDWAHGAERTNAILAGEDELTNADLAAWHRLIGGERPPVKVRPEIGVELVRQGVEVEMVAYLADCGVNALKSALSNRRTKPWK